MIGASLDDLQIVRSGFKKQAALRLPTLWINQPAQGILPPGRWLVADIGIDNPDRRVFNEIRLTLQYPPDAVEIVDADRGNWIDEGTNLLDGPFHETWPWDIHYSNMVDLRRGLLVYRMGMEGLREQPSGTLGRIFARVVKPVQAPVFKWAWQENAPSGTPTTGVFLFNKNIYPRAVNQHGGEDLAQDLGLNPLGIPADEKADPSLYRSEKDSASARP